MSVGKVIVDAFHKVGDAFCGFTTGVKQCFSSLSMRVHELVARLFPCLFKKQETSSTPSSLRSNLEVVDLTQTVSSVPQRTEEQSRHESSADSHPPITTEFDQGLVVDVQLVPDGAVSGLVLPPPAVVVATGSAVVAECVAPIISEAISTQVAASDDVVAPSTTATVAVEQVAEVAKEKETGPVVVAECVAPTTSEAISTQVAASDDAVAPSTTATVAVEQVAGVAKEKEETTTSATVGDANVAPALATVVDAPHVDGGTVSGPVEEPKADTRTIAQRVHGLRVRKQVNRFSSGDVKHSSGIVDTGKRV